jgi:hypothetical protein
MTPLTCRQPRTAFVAMVVLACLTAQPARAGILIDSFTETTLSTSGLDGAVFTDHEETLRNSETLPSVFGAGRESILQVTNNPAGELVFFYIDAAFGELIFSAPDGTGALLTLHYAGLGVDVSNDSGFGIRFLDNDQTFPVTLTLSDGTHTGSMTLLQAQMDSGDLSILSFPYQAAEFDDLELASISSFTVLFDATSASGFGIDFLQSLTPVVAVPEPATFLPFGMGGLVVLGVSLRRRTRAKAHTPSGPTPSGDLAGP